MLVWLRKPKEPKEATEEKPKESGGLLDEEDLLGAAPLFCCHALRSVQFFGRAMKDEFEEFEDPDWAQNSVRKLLETATYYVCYVDI